MATNISTTVVQTANMTPTVTLVNGDTLNLFATGLVLAGGAVSVGVVAGDNSTFNVGGDILSLNYKGIEAGNASVFNIAATATVFGRDWAVWSGGGTTLTNAGDLGALTRAIQFFGEGNTLNNSGNIRGATGHALLIADGKNSITNTGYIDGGLDAVEINGNDNTIVNSGTVRGVRDGISFGNTGGVNAFFNSGTVSGGTAEGFDGGEGQDFVVNNGLIRGGSFAVHLSAGNDVYDGRNGSIVAGTSGGVNGDTGDDIIYGGAAGENLQGGANNDQIYGGGGGDEILGGDGIDLLVGGTGGDVIRGGTGVDLIVFNAGDNGDLIQGFNEGGARDGFDLRGYFNATGFTGTNPRAAGVMAVLQNGADTDVYLHGAFAFRIQGVVAAAIDDSYFLFQ